MERVRSREVKYFYAFTLLRRFWVHSASGKDRLEFRRSCVRCCVAVPVPDLDQSWIVDSWSKWAGSGIFQFRAVTGRKGEGLNDSPTRSSNAFTRHFDPPSVHVTVHIHGGFSNMAPLSNGSRCKSTVDHRIVHLYRPHCFHSFRPSSKSRLCASPAMFSLGGV